MEKELIDVLKPTITSEGIFISYDNLVKAEGWCDKTEKTFVLNLNNVIKEIESKQHG